MGTERKIKENYMIKKSSIFYTNKYEGIAEKIKAFLNNQKDFLSARTQNVGEVSSGHHSS